jgi:DNA repair exonuclease SbcCD nuclease subunit
MIFVTGDTHAGIDIHKLNSTNFPQNKNLTKADFVLVAGDAGFLWDASPEEKYWHKWLRQKNFTTLFIDGNHENFDLLNSYSIEQWYGGKVHQINNSLIHLMRGQVFNIGDYRIFTFGGAISSDQEYRKEHLTWWPEERPTDAEYQEGLSNLERHGWEVDFVITHTCPSSALPLINTLFDKSKNADEITEYLEQIHRKLRYKHWYFGHFHQDHQLDDQQTIVYHKVLKIGSFRR